MSCCLEKFPLMFPEYLFIYFLFLSVIHWDISYYENTLFHVQMDSRIIGLLYCYIEIDQTFECSNALLGVLLSGRECIMSLCLLLECAGFAGRFYKMSYTLSHVTDYGR